MLHKLGNQSFYLLLSQQIRRYHKRTSSLTFPLDFKISRVKVYSTLWWIHKRIDIGKHVEGDWWPKRPKYFHIVQYLCYHINRESSIAASRFSYNIAVNSYSIWYFFYSCMKSFQVLLLNLDQQALAIVYDEGVHRPCTVAGVFPYE